MSAADCFLSLSGALTKVADNKKLKLNARAKDQAITFVHSPTTDKKEKLDSNFLMSMIDRDYTLWHHLDDIICLVKRLLSVSYTVLVLNSFIHIFIMCNNDIL